MRYKSINQLKIEIENKKRNLNQIILEGSETEKILKFSQELDLLINDYYSLNKEEKVAEI